MMLYFLAGTEDALIAWLETNATDRDDVTRQLWFDRGGWDIWACGTQVCACQSYGQSLEFDVALRRLEHEYTPAGMRA